MPTRLPRWSVAVVAAGLALFALGLYAPYYRPIDDAYISYRYSKNMAAGHGLRWNPGEAPVEGFTNFLLVLTEVPIIGLGLDPLQGARALSILCFLGVAWMSWRWLRAHLVEPSAPYVAALGVALLLSIPFVPFHVLSGLETVSFAFHLLLPIYLLQRWLTLSAADRIRGSNTRWLGAAALSSFVAGLCRPEGFIVAGGALGLAVLLDLYEARRDEGLLRRVLVLSAWLTAAFVLPTLAYHAWRYVYFGDVFPNSYHIKVDAVSQKDMPGLPQLLELEREPAVHLLLALVLMRRTLRRTDLLLMLPLAFAAWFYLRSEHIMAFNHRFYVPYLPLLVLLAAPSLALLCTGSALARTAKSALFVAAFYYTFLVTSPVYAHFVTHTWAQRPAAEETHFMLGKRLARLANVHHLLIVGPDAGAMPYFSEAKWIDPVGLNDNFIARHVTAPKQALIDYLFARNPDIFILCKAGMRYVTGLPGPLGDETELIAKDPRFVRYEPVARFQKNSGGVYAYAFYVRRDLPTLENVKQVLHPRPTAR